MTNDYSTDAQAVADALNAVYENKQTNKKNSISGDYSSDNESYPTVKAVKNEFGTKVTSFSSTTSDTNYPSEKLVKDSLDDKISKSNTSGLVKNDGTIDTNTYLTSASMSNYIEKSNTSGLVKNDGTIDTNTYLTQHQSLTDYVQKSNTNGLLKNDGTVDTTTYLSSHQSLDGTVVTIEKATSGIGDNIARYTIKQGGTALTNGVIDIPKDFLVKSGELKTCTTADDPVEGYVVGDKYIDFVINSKDSSSTASHMYILVSDLVEDTTYSADNTTLELNNTTFKIKNSGVDTTQIKDGAVTSDKIASAVKSSWLSSSDVQSEISAFASALAEAINPSSP